MVNCKLYKSVLFCLLLFVCGTAHASLEKKPWFSPPYQFHVGTDLSPNFFSDVQNGYNPIGYHSTNIDWALYLLAPFSDTFDAQVEVNFNKTSQLNFNLKTLVLQVRKLFLNDIQGDWVSLCWGFNYRYVTKIRLTDVATPYHSISNFEVVATIGKEFAKKYEWSWRTFLWAAAGQGNTGFPWGRFDYNVQGKVYENFVLTGGAEGYFGAGSQDSVDVNAFNSYAKIKHRSVDVYAQFGYNSKIYGDLSFKYAFRPYSKAFPEYFNAFIFTYDYPFSF